MSGNQRSLGRDRRHGELFSADFRRFTQIFGNFEKADRADWRRYGEGWFQLGSPNPRRENLRKSVKICGYIFPVPIVALPVELQKSGRPITGFVVDGLTHLDLPSGAGEVQLRG